MRHLAIADHEYLDKLSEESELVQKPFEDILSDLEEALETGELTINEVILILEQYS